MEYSMAFKNMLVLPVKISFLYVFRFVDISRKCQGKFNEGKSLKKGNCCIILGCVVKNSMDLNPWEGRNFGLVAWLSPHPSCALRPVVVSR